MKYLNNLSGFSWAAVKDDMAKVCIDNESFWLDHCEKIEDNRYIGYIANNIFSDRFTYSEKVTFSID